MTRYAAKSDDARRIVAVLWRRIGETEAKALTHFKYAAGRGARHVGMGKHTRIDEFVRGAPGVVSDDEGRSYRIPVFGPGTDARTVEIKFSSRTQGKTVREEWQIPRASQVPAWKPGDKLPDNRDDMKDYCLLIFRLRNGTYHSRVASPDEISVWPAALREIITSDADGVATIDDN